MIAISSRAKWKSVEKRSVEPKIESDTIAVSEVMMSEKNGIVKRDTAAEAVHRAEDTVRDRLLVSQADTTVIARRIVIGLSQILIGTVKKSHF